MMSELISVALKNISDVMIKVWKRYG